MSDVHKLGPHGEAESPQPATVDLTRIDIRRGTLYLPRRFYGALPEGELQAVDGATGDELSVRFQPPRQLEGLAPFFEQHELRPNDGVSLSLGKKLRLMPVRRDRRHVAPQAGEGEKGATREPAQGKRLEATGNRAEHEAAPPLVAPPPPPFETKTGWQNVLHDPTPRRAQPARVQPVGPEPAPPRGEAAQQVGTKSDHGGRVRSDNERPTAASDHAAKGRPQDQTTPERSTPSVAETRSAEANAPLDVGRPEAWHQAPRDLSRLGSAQVPAADAPTPAGESHLRAAEQEPAQPRSVERERQRTGRVQQGLFEERTKPAQSTSVEAPAQRSAGPASKPDVEKARTPRDNAKGQPEEREAVTVGAPAQADAAGAIGDYLRRPSTPAIVRAVAVAEALGLPLEQVQKGLAKVAEESEGSVTPIRADVYLVKRGK